MHGSNGLVAQLAEHQTENLGVGGSIPSQATRMHIIVLIIEMLSPSKKGATSFPSAGNVV